MPTVTASLRELNRLAGTSFSAQKMSEEAILFAKGEIDDVEKDTLKIDIKDSNRPDLLGVEGIAREIAGQYGKKTGLPAYKVKPSGRRATVDTKLKNIRPNAVCAVVKGVTLNDEQLAQFIGFSEKITGTFGRKRREVAIGVFDLKNVHGNVKYKAAKSTEKFVPLGYKDKLTLTEILSLHPKGEEYGHLLKKARRYPLLVDGKNNVLSMPPIINSETHGKLSPGKMDVFIDITGFKQELLEVALETLCAALAERGGKIYSVQMQKGKEKTITPKFKPKNITVPYSTIKKMYGTLPPKQEMTKLLSKRRMNAKADATGLKVTYSSYRADILHPADIVEEILIAMDYNKIKPRPVELPVTGSELSETVFMDRVREACVGLSLQEVLTFTLSSREKQSTLLNIQNEKLVEIANPVSSEWAVLRSRILPGILEFMAANKHAAYPQHLFEVGKIVRLDPKPDTGVEERTSLCIALTGRKATINDLRSAVESVLLAINFPAESKETKAPYLKKGFCATLKGKNVEGMLGEIDQTVLKKLGLSLPVMAAEIQFI